MLLELKCCLDVNDAPFQLSPVILLAVSEPKELCSRVVLAERKLSICEQVIAEQVPLQELLMIPSIILMTVNRLIEW